MKTQLTDPDIPSNDDPQPADQPVITGERRTQRQRNALTVGIGVTVIIVVALIAPIFIPHSATDPDVLNRVQPPVGFTNGSWSHPLGTDGLGRDVLARVLAGTRTTLMVGLASCLLAAVVGVTLGMLSGYLGGVVDRVIMGLVDLQLSLPGFLIILLVIGAIGPSTTTVIVVLGFYGWMVYARVVRGMTMSLRMVAFVEAAEVAGCSTARVLRRHIFANMIGPVLALMALEFARILLSEAGLSYIGFGVQPPDISWGLMIQDGQSYIRNGWWMIVFPGLAIVVAVAAVTIAGQRLRRRYELERVWDM